jgi:AhpD family alkylhydroperoxidase
MIYDSIRYDKKPGGRSNPQKEQKKSCYDEQASIWSINVKEAFTYIMRMIEYADASPEVRAVYDDIMAVRKTDWVNNFWKAIANDPATLKRTWESIKQVMAPGALDPLTKQMLYIAVSATNGCGYCIASHIAAAREIGMTDAMFGELMAVVGMANETNRLASGYEVDIDPQFRTD